LPTSQRTRCYNRGRKQIAPCSEYRSALIDGVRRGLSGEHGSVLRAAQTQAFESLDADGTRLTTLAERAAAQRERRMA
jgi:hypothetical protein